ncbi:MAG: hypothetical protein RMZ69_11410 [Nostoc sp. ChiQUE01a]|nr:hypothetical protein [Nostoc sp. ChiQUE01a]
MLNSKFKIQALKTISSRGLFARLKLGLPVEVGVLNPFIYDKPTPARLPTPPLIRLPWVLRSLMLNVSLISIIFCGQKPRTVY